ncbi:aminopeptidase N [Rhizorhabdus dicambivorans]|uniref:Aminopeptidase N n=1 Tax=Rhizorhabdus dicambivorans TaxID=1850238 RepID=A0A2A4FXC9_9SPHN|nr:aminopeptidase N [Rhizorhabdus dicambivorans]ATE63242.1 aminopeptidase N [Rhizorhabdus dicambivorans]PCE43454.1 aminopeptidase N [Rhizorhabdus dicambivorans]
MLDVQAAAANPPVIRREDYRKPDWLMPDVFLDFALDPARALVTGRLDVTRNGAHNRPLRLHGDGLVPLKVLIDGEAQADAWRMDGPDLVIDLPGDAHVVETQVAISPEANSQLMGLYASGGNLCSQCEPEGFRRMVFFLDRPDVLSRYRVRMDADKARFPVLLSNGDLTGSGDLEHGRHWAEWTDPFPKPSYLFALVAANLSANVDHFTTKSGREVKLAIWVVESDLPKTGHAMAALKASMAWDEKVYGLEYDLGEYNIVAVHDFNFGAMENKSLNIFNSRYILADPDTATDIDYDGVSGVVAHEYFHNWSGNRVTCRDWFQLSLKEGFTVFRDQCFTADQGSAAVKRIEDVRLLRAAQFQEDAGPLAHPIRPESYMEVSNFYTATVYNKGAEVVRMLHTMLGPQKFRAGSDLYFARHDGTAATCEDFVVAMEDASGVDLSQFRLWYSQAGTPRVRATLSHEPAGGRALLTLEQTVPPTPGQPEKKPMPLPLRIALFGERSQRKFEEERLVVLDGERCEILFEGIAERPVLSINRGFSAPVVIDSDRSAADLAFLSAHDDDPFARYEAMQQLMVDTLTGAVATGQADHGPVIDAVRNTLTDPKLDASFIGETMLLPSEAFIGDQMAVVDPVAIHKAREALRRDLGQALEGEWRDAYERTRANRFELSPQAKGARRLRSIALGFIMASGASDGPEIALRQFHDADNMTDRQGAFGALANSMAPERDAAIAAFYERFRDNGLVLDKWFSTQAFSIRPDTLDRVEELSQHPDFTLANPNRLRSLVGAMSGNQLIFHDASGRGYRFLADMLLKVDGLNPQTAAKLVPPLGRWRRFDEGRAGLMKAQLQRLLDTPGLSKDMFEQVSKSLG